LPVSIALVGTPAGEAAEAQEQVQPRRFPITVPRRAYEVSVAVGWIPEGRNAIAVAEEAQPLRGICRIPEALQGHHSSSST